MIKQVSKNKLRQKRHVKIRTKLSGTPERPRLSVYRSVSNIHAQIIDDTTGTTLASASTVVPSIKAQIKNGGNVEAAKIVGQELGKIALEKGITKVVFDRGGYAYHGRIKALADAAREAGLDF